jgi:hypothetical protein
VLSREQMTALVEQPDGETARSQRDRAALELLYAAGLRASELCLLKVDELHLALGVVRPTGKGSKERVVPMGRPAVRALEKYLAEGRPALLKGRPSPYVFIGNRGRPLSRMGLFKIVRRYAAGAGIARAISPHKLRHAFAVRHSGPPRRLFARRRPKPGAPARPTARDGKLLIQLSKTVAPTRALRRARFRRGGFWFPNPLPSAKSGRNSTPTCRGSAAADSAGQ